MNLYTSVTELFQPKEYFELNKVIDYLYITNVYTAQKEETLKLYNIKHVISLYPVSLPEFNQLYINIYDTPSADIKQYFEETYDFIEKHRMNKESVLVHCHAGRSRASTIVIYYLMRKFNITFDKAYNYLKTKRSIIEPNEGFKNQLLEFEKTLTIDTSPQNQIPKPYDAMDTVYENFTL
jgi:protein-tyrosine phosphatase